MTTTTVGQHLVNEILPEELRNHSRVLDKKGVQQLLQQVAREHPDDYREVSHRLNQLGRQVAQDRGGMSFGIRHLRRSRAANEIRQRIQSQLGRVLSDDSLSDQQRADEVVKIVGREGSSQQKAILEEALKEKNPLALQVLSGSRGKPMNLASLLGSDMLYSDHRDEVIPIPVLRSYSEGLSPEEYWAGTYGARRGIIATKFCLAEGTLVLMADFSVKPIEAVNSGDFVFALDGQDRLTKTRVAQRFENGVRPCFMYSFQEGRSKSVVSVKATARHKLYSTYRSYNGSLKRKMLPLGELNQGRNSAIVPRGHSAYADDLPRRFVNSEPCGSLPTYDLEVEHPTHRFVLANMLVVSNSTQEAGFLAKQLSQAGHRLVVSDEDDEQLDDTRGMVVDTDDMDNEGALLARDVGPYRRNTPLTPKIMKHLSRLGQHRIMVRSPLVGGSPSGGVYARDVGIREKGQLPGRGEQVGLQAAQALSEPISQGQLSAKHSGGVAGEEKAVGGFQALNQLIQVPKKMKGGAAHATLDGTVQRVEPAPAGGQHVTIDDQKHYVGNGFKVKVKKGDEIEAGDMLSDGIPNPALVTKYKGVGEGRRYFVNEFRKAMQNSGMQGHRRNIELLARGLVNHVKMLDETDEHSPDDVIPYSTLEHTYRPREGHQRLAPKKAVGQYLERPVLHYTIGTQLRPSMLRDLEEFGVQEVDVHHEPPPFEPHMVRGMYQLQHDPDWMTQMYGSGLKKSLLESTARGATSDVRGSSFVPSLAAGTDFGNVPDRQVIKPQPGYEIPAEPEEPAPQAPAGRTFFGGRFKLGADKQAMNPIQSKAPEVPQPLEVPAPPGGRALADNNILPTDGQANLLSPSSPNRMAGSAMQQSLRQPGEPVFGQLPSNPTVPRRAALGLKSDPVQSVDENTPYPTTEAGAGNSLNPLSGSGLARGAIGQTGASVASRLAPKTPVAARQVRQASRLTRLAREAARTAAPGANIAKSTGGVSGALSSAGALPALGGFVATNAAAEAADAAGVLPQWAGGTGMGQSSWDQRQFSQDASNSSTLGVFGKSLMNPLKAITEIGSGAYETGRHLGDNLARKVYSPGLISRSKQ